VLKRAEQASITISRKGEYHMDSSCALWWVRKQCSSTTLTHRGWYWKKESRSRFFRCVELMSTTIPRSANSSRCVETTFDREPNRRKCDGEVGPSAPTPCVVLPSSTEVSESLESDLRGLIVGSNWHTLLEISLFWSLNGSRQSAKANSKVGKAV
jgi:hypothetical protein